MRTIGFIDERYIRNRLDGNYDPCRLHGGVNCAESSRFWAQEFERLLQMPTMDMRAPLGEDTLVEDAMHVVAFEQPNDSLDGLVGLMPLYPLARLERPFGVMYVGSAIARWREDVGIDHVVQESGLMGPLVLPYIGVAFAFGLNEFLNPETMPKWGRRA